MTIVSTAIGESVCSRAVVHVVFELPFVKSSRRMLQGPCAVHLWRWQRARAHVNNHRKQTSWRTNTHTGITYLVFTPLSGVYGTFCRGVLTSTTPHHHPRFRSAAFPLCGRKTLTQTQNPFQPRRWKKEFESHHELSYSMTYCVILWKILFLGYYIKNIEKLSQNTEKKSHYFDMLIHNFEHSHYFDILSQHFEIVIFSFKMRIFPLFVL